MLTHRKGRAKVKIHHIGYLVDDIEHSANEFKKLGFSLRTCEAVEDLSREVFIMFLDNKALQTVELIQPFNDTSLFNGLRKKYRNSPYHIGYETDDLHGQIENLVTLGGYTMIQPPQPAPAIQGCPNVAFLFNKYLGIIELVERVKI